MQIRLLIIFIISFFYACKSSSQEINNKNDTQVKSLTYLALGDSYTIGESVNESQRWPLQLTKQLNSRGLKILEPRIIAKTGWTTDELKAKIDAENITETFGLVSLLIGVNNQYRGRSVEEFRKEYIELLETSIRFAGNQTKRVFVVSIPDWGVTPFGKNSPKKSVSEQIDLFNSVKKEETLNRGILYIDITPISREAVNDPSLIADDGLHPSGKMYRQWVEKITPELLKILSP